MSHVANVGPLGFNGQRLDSARGRRLWLGKSSYARWRVRPWALLRYELLDVSLALMTRRLKDLHVILRCQERSKQANRCEVDAAVGEPLENHRKPACGPRRLDAVIGSVLRQVEDLPAIGEERRAAFRQIQAPRVEFHQERDELDSRVAFARRRAVNLRQQIAIGQSTDGRDVDHHPAHIPSSFSTPGTARHRAIVVRDTISAVARANMRLRRNVVDAAGGPRASRTRRELASKKVSSVCLDLDARRTGIRARPFAGRSVGPRGASRDPRSTRELDEVVVSQSCPTPGSRHRAIVILPLLASAVSQPSMKSGAAAGMMSVLRDMLTNDGRVPWPVRRTVMATLRRLFLVIVGAAGVSVLNVATVAQSLTLDKVLAQLGDYLVTYEETLSAVVAQEEYRQDDRSSAGTQTVIRKRLLRSDFLFLRLPGEVLWFGVRDAILVDGKPVRDRAPRLDNVLIAGGDNPLPELTRIAAENARFNLGDVVRTINAPTQVLALLHPRHRSRFTFRKDGEQTIERQRLWRVRFREITKPSLIKTVEGADQLTSGMVWVHPGDGYVVRTVLELGGDLAADYMQRPNDGQFCAGPTAGVPSAGQHGRSLFSSQECESLPVLRTQISASFKRLCESHRNDAAGDSSSPSFESDVRSH